MIEELRIALSQPVDGIGLELFRFCLGAIIFIRTLRKYGHDLKYYSSCLFFFNYEFAPYIRPSGKVGMALALALKAGSSFCFALGLWFPVSSALLFLSYTYIFLLDKARYNNHYYLTSLLLFLFCIVGDASEPWVPCWKLWIFKLQLLIVYVYGGLNKINSDWLLRAMPLKKWFEEFEGRTEFNGRLHHYCVTPGIAAVVESTLKKPATAYLFSWGGMLVDLFVVTLMCYPPTLPVALPFFLAFTLFNHWFFVIGAFPYINYAYLLLFIDPSTLRSLIGA